MDEVQTRKTVAKLLAGWTRVWIPTRTRRFFFLFVKTRRLPLQPIQDVKLPSDPHLMSRLRWCAASPPFCGMQRDSFTFHCNAYSDCQKIKPHLKYKIKSGLISLLISLLPPPTHTHAVIIEQDGVAVKLRHCTVIPRLTKIIRPGITFVGRNVISRRFL